MILSEKEIDYLLSMLDEELREEEIRENEISLESLYTREED